MRYEYVYRKYIAKYIEKVYRKYIEKYRTVSGNI